MAGDWIKIKLKLHDSINVYRIAGRLDITTEKTVFLLYFVADWFSSQGDYGIMDIEPSLIDYYLETPGFADALIAEDWLRVESGRCILRGFTNVSSVRKSIGRKLRSQVLAAGACAHCGSTSSLEIDHIIPVSKGGKTVPANLQPLCKPCNIRKGAK